MALFVTPLFPQRRCASFLLLTFLATVAACGRTSNVIKRQQGATPDAGVDGAIDGGVPPRDFRVGDLPFVDGGPACEPDCSSLCERVTECTGDALSVCETACEADWSAEVRACLESRVCGTFDCAAIDVCLANPPPVKPDLVVASFSAESEGDTVIFEATICNFGTADADAFYTDFYYGREPTGTFGDAANIHPGLLANAPNNCLVSQVRRVGLGPGTYSAYLAIDVDEVIDESNEQNNTAGPVEAIVREQTPDAGPDASGDGAVDAAAEDAANPPADLGPDTGSGDPDGGADVAIMGPDLVVTAFDAVIIDIDGASVRYTAEVCNQGSAPSSASNLHVYYNRATDPTTSDVGDNSDDVAALDPEQCVTVNLVGTDFVAGEYRSLAQVDVGDPVAELSEDNNVSSPIGFTVVIPPKPDIRIPPDGFRAAVNGSTVTYDVEVCNDGDADAQNIRVDLYYDRAIPPNAGDLGSDSTVIPELARGTCTAVPVQFVRGSTAAGTYLSWVQVDGSQQIDEHDETNNVAGGVPVDVVSLPDLRVENFGAQIDANDVTYRLAVCNRGDSPAIGVFRVDLYLDRENAPNPGDLGDRLAIVAGILGAGQCTSEWVVTIQQERGSYTAWAQVDGQQVIAELDDANNVSGGIAVLVTEPLPCGVLCAGAFVCGVVQPSHLVFCPAWCEALPEDNRICMSDAVDADDCGAMVDCGVQLPPSFCDEFCEFAVDNCGFPSLQGCISSCGFFPTETVACLEAAVSEPAPCAASSRCLFP